ncbi:SGNH/GDSL hydrolase family protein [Oligoflexia bacterium]|nr:SGNH/GDSL hydrolase family protein [Oligoflexia bacterium]
MNKFIPRLFLGLAFAVACTGSVPSKLLAATQPQCRTPEQNTQPDYYNFKPSAGVTAVAIIGDSNSSPPFNNFAHGTWAAKMANAFDLHVYNIAIGGAVAAPKHPIQGFGKEFTGPWQTEQAIKVNPLLHIISMGTNDILSGSDPAVVLGHILDLVHLIIAADAQANVFVRTVPLIAPGASNSVWLNFQITKLNELLANKQAPLEKYMLVNTPIDFKNYHLDGIHFKEAGHIQIAEKLVVSLSPAGTDPGDPDSDHDNISDLEEKYIFTSNPLDSDSDDDGIPDGVEIGLKTDQNRADTDGDGIHDGTEVGLQTGSSAGVSACLKIVIQGTANDLFKPDLCPENTSDPLVKDNALDQDGDGCADVVPMPTLTPTVQATATTVATKTPKVLPSPTSLPTVIATPPPNCIEQSFAETVSQIRKVGLAIKYQGRAARRFLRQHHCATNKPKLSWQKKEKLAHVKFNKILNQIPLVAHQCQLSPLPATCGEVDIRQVQLELLPAGKRLARLVRQQYLSCRGRFRKKERTALKQVTGQVRLLRETLNLVPKLVLVCKN